MKGLTTDIGSSSSGNWLWCINIMLFEGETHLDERKSVPDQLKTKGPDDGTGTNHREGTCSQASASHIAHGKTP